MNSEILISGDQTQSWWINTALKYLPEEIMRDEGRNLVIVGVGDFGGCRLPKQYREREIILLSEWIFPPPGHSEEEESGKCFIITLLHEIAHAVNKHKSPSLDKLSTDEKRDQENEADNIAIDWYNSHVRSLDNDYLTSLEVSTFRELVERFGKLCGAIEKYKWDWHQKGST